MKSLSGALFAPRSLLAPFFLGTAVGAVATGQVRTAGAGNELGAWTSPTALMTGGLFVAACAYIGAVYLVGDSHRRGDKPRWSATSPAARWPPGLVTGALAAANLRAAALERAVPVRPAHRGRAAAGVVSVVGRASPPSWSSCCAGRGRCGSPRPPRSPASSRAGGGRSTRRCCRPSMSLAEGSAPQAALLRGARGHRHGRAAGRAVVRLPVLAAAARAAGRTESSRELRRAARADNRCIAEPAVSAEGGKAVPALASVLAGAAVLRRLCRSGKRER